MGLGPSEKLYFAGGWPGHRLADGLFRSLSFLQNGVHLLGDRHFDRHLCASPTAAFVVSTPSATMPCIPAMISSSLRPLPSSTPTVRLRESPPVQVSTRSPRPASPAIVSRRPPQATVKASDFGQSAGNERSGRVVAKTETVHNSGGDGDDVLQRAAQFDADWVVIAIDAEIRVAEFALHSLRQLRVHRGHGDCRGIAFGNFLRERWSAERASRGVNPPGAACNT